MFFNMGEILSRVGQPEGAEEAYRKAIELDVKGPRDVTKDALMNLADDKATAGDVEASLALRQELVDVDPADGELHLQLATALRAAGHYEKAVLASMMAFMSRSSSLE